MRHLPLLLALLASLLVGRAAICTANLQLTAITTKALVPGANLLTNGGFEVLRTNGFPAGWQWDRRNTDAACTVDRAQPHRGQQALHLTNGTAFGAHVYGMLWRTRPVALEAGKPYTLSAWVKSERPGILSLIGGADWQYRVQARAKDGQWHRLWMTFTPAAKDTNFVVRLNTESPTPGVWLDDVKLEPGTAPTVDAAEAGELALDAEAGETVVQDDGPFQLAFTLRTARAVTGTLTASIGGAEYRQPVQVAAGIWQVAIHGEATALDTAARLAQLRLETPGATSRVASAPVRFYSATNALQRLAALQRQLPALQSALAAAQARAQDLSYPLVTATVLENFLRYAEEDARHHEVKRAQEQIEDLEAMAARLGQELREAQAGLRQYPPVPRWTGEARPVIQSSAFLAATRLPGAAAVTRPVFFYGYGHFGRVVADMEKWPAYGGNMIQIEIGPSRLFPKEGQTNLAVVNELRRTLDRAQTNGVAVCLLISPHYFPDWALKKWPHLRVRREGFLGYCLHAPEGRQLLRQYIAALLPELKGHPALHSICLSNEPINEEEPCAAGAEAWHAWLAQRHGEVATLNARHGAAYPSLAAVPLPNPFAPRPARGLWLDYLRFNQEFFAGWHQQLADAVHEVAPDLPVHAKAMTWTMQNDSDLKYGVDATLFGQFSNINGNDAANMYNFGDGEYAQSWQGNAMGHDLQRSVLDAPVFNTENHVITDRDTRPVPPAHLRAALWQAAIHGQSATAIWVWERTFDAKSDFAGSILHRPACAEIVGRTCHDLNRAALEITAIQQAPPQLLLLQSVTSAAWDGGRHTECLSKLYEALSFTGLKVGFVTERQLEAGLRPPAQVLLVPRITHFSANALATLRRYAGQIIFVGNTDLLGRDEYDRPVRPEVKAAVLPLPEGAYSARELHQQLLARLAAWNLAPAIQLQDARRQHVWGVAWRSGTTRSGPVHNLCNYLKEPQTVTLLRGGKTIMARDVLTGQRLSGSVTLAPLEVRLLRQE